MAKKEAKKSSGTMDLLLQNTIALQKTLANLAVELKTLNKKVSELYDLFETASAAFKEGAIAESATTSVPQELLDKINALVEQNRTIAKGLLLLEKALREKETKETAILKKPTKLLKTLRKKPTPEEAEEAETAETETEEYKPQPLPEFSF